MRITNIQVENFRLLKDVTLSLEEKSTVIVGRNNAGKTSLTEIFRRLLQASSPYFLLEDFSIDAINQFQEILQRKLAGAENDEIRPLLPVIRVNIFLEYDQALADLGLLSEFIIDLDETNNMVQIQISYELNDGKIDVFFDGLSKPVQDGSPIVDVSKLRDKVSKLYSARLLAIDPTDENNTSEIEFFKLKNLISVGFINAQRGLDDVTHKENDVLGKVLENLFKTAENEGAPEDLKQHYSDIDNAVTDLQVIVDNRFQRSANLLLPSLGIFGYPGLIDPNIQTETTLKASSILERFTRIKYNVGGNVTLPETYNGLGSRNLIYILFRLFEFFRDYQSRPIKPQFSLIFIEEPEAHLHPQMQEVFIRQINIIKDYFCTHFNNNEPWPVQFIVTTHSTHIANEASFASIRYFLTKGGGGIPPHTVIKDLSVDFGSTPEDKDFLHKYLTLTNCDLFFADKAIIVEGSSENILMPRFLEIIDAANGSDHKLKSQYITTVLVGGAHAFHFYRFLEYLEVKCLIITDIDAGKLEGGFYYNCLVSEATVSKNSSIRRWINDEVPGYLPIEDVLGYSAADKTIENRRIAYQIPDAEGMPCGRSFEEAFIISNLAHYGIDPNPQNEIEAKVDNYAKQNRKTDFAIQNGLDERQWTIPLYIKEGLEWLRDPFEEVVAVPRGVAMAVVEPYVAGDAVENETKAAE
jgi:putative ATP-dependent endonuclease of OLD family